MKYSEEDAARIIQRAVRNRRSRKTPEITDQMKQQELEVLRNIHRQRLESKEREYLFLSKLPAEAVLKLYLKKQHQAATLLQAFWRGRRVRRMLENREVKKSISKIQKKTTLRTYKGPPDNFYKKIDLERFEHLIKQVRLKGSGDLEVYKNEYSKFLDKQIAWEKLRLQRKADRNEISDIFKTLVAAKSLKTPLEYNVTNPTPQEIVNAKKVHKSKIVNPKKWWLSLEWDDDIEAVGSNILEQIQEYKLNMYRDRKLEFA